MHPTAAETSGSAITQTCNYLGSRQATSMEQKSIRVNTTTGSSETTRQEQVSYRVTLTDDEVIYLNVVYLSDHLGTGFHSFQLVLGISTHRNQITKLSHRRVRQFRNSTEHR